MKDVWYKETISEKRGLLKQLLVELDTVIIESPNFSDGDSIEKQIQIDQFNYEVNDAKKMLCLAYESLEMKATEVSV